MSEGPGNAIALSLCIMSAILVLSWVVWGTYYIVVLWGPGRRQRAEERRAERHRDGIPIFEMEPRGGQTARERQA
ncbi:hypothetical protein F5X68DRAFT_236877 [Plectosphaerella plurivora]|uniref:Uncharacterized protein n=1 Tax=Plectosphaerella plurivora TaxID=936078 RepID=A0A9P8V030_9PEZI|nr:hypothetical protein F5X68DRAFT_236877 [Plectosphaerella plurivora]